MDETTEAYPVPRPVRVRHVEALDFRFPELALRSS